MAPRVGAVVAGPLFLARLLFVFVQFTHCDPEPRVAPAPAVRRSRCGSASSPTSPTPPPWSALKKGFFTKNLGSRHAEDHGLQHRHPGDHRPAGRPAGRGLRRPEPGHQRLAEVGRQRDQDHLRRGHRRRLGRRQAGITSAASSRARRWPRRRWATPRTWRCATGSSRTAWPPPRPAGETSPSSRPTPTPTRCSSSSPGQIAGGSEPAPYDVEMVKDGGKVLFTRAGRARPSWS